MRSVTGMKFYLLISALGIMAAVFIELMANALDYLDLLRTNANCAGRRSVTDFAIGDSCARKRLECIEMEGVK